MDVACSKNFSGRRSRSDERRHTQPIIRYTRRSVISQPPTARAHERRRPLWKEQGTFTRIKDR
jgi:hypothetical protein